jgi:hypothetical protein
LQDSTIRTPKENFLVSVIANWATRLLGLAACFV